MGGTHGRGALPRGGLPGNNLSGDVYAMRGGEEAKGFVKAFTIHEDVNMIRVKPSLTEFGRTRKGHLF